MRQTKQERREFEEKQRKKQMLRRENKKPESEKQRRKRLPKRVDGLKLRKKLPKLPANKLSKPFQILSLIILI